MGAFLGWSHGWICPVCARQISRLIRNGHASGHNLPRDPPKTGGWYSGTLPIRCPASYLTQQEALDMIVNGGPRDRTEILQNVIDAAMSELAQISKAAVTYGPDLADGAVIRFRKRFAVRGERYRYAAIRAQGLWYVTGRVTASYTWEELCRWMDGVGANSGRPTTAFEVLHKGGKDKTKAERDAEPDCPHTLDDGKNCAECGWPVTDRSS